MSDTSTVRAQRVAKQLRRRHWAETRFRLYGLTAVLLSVGFMVFLFANIIGKGYLAFSQTYIRVDINYAEELIDPNGTRLAQDLADGNYQGVIKASMRAQFPDVVERSEQRKLYGLLSESAERALKEHVEKNPSLIGHSDSVWLLADDHIDLLVKGVIATEAPEEDRRVDDQEIKWMTALTAGHRVERHFNWSFFTEGDSRA
jgi:phosphate transport system permease protein